MTDEKITIGELGGYTNNISNKEGIKKVVKAINDGLSPDLSAYQKKLTAGDNITITDEDVISATDTTYTAGSNISISDEKVISATVPPTLTAGDGITIDSNNKINLKGYTQVTNDTIGSLVLFDEIATGSSITQNEYIQMLNKDIMLVLSNNNAGLWRHMNVFIPKKSTTIQSWNKFIKTIFSPNTSLSSELLAYTEWYKASGLTLNDSLKVGVYVLNTTDGTVTHYNNGSDAGGVSGTYKLVDDILDLDRTVTNKTKKFVMYIRD